MMRATLVHISIFLALAAFAEKQPFERYQSIIDRQMFGPLPKGFDPAKMPSEVAKSGSDEQKELTKEQEELKKAVHFSVLNVRQTGEVEVGFSDLSDKESPVHYFLKVGESQNGWKVESADVETATATLEKDGVVLELSLGENSTKGGGAAKKADSATAGSAAKRTAGTLFGTARERRIRQAEEQRAQEEQRRKAEREADREAFKQEFQEALANVKRDLEEKAEQRKAEEERARAEAAKAKAEESRTKSDGDENDARGDSGDEENNN